MKRQAAMESKLKSGLAPVHLELVNESHRHNVPAGSESHFKLTLVAEAFRQKSLVDRHRTVYALLSEELQSGVHALSLHLFSPEEWDAQKGTSSSPPCLGGEK